MMLSHLRRAKSIQVLRQALLRNEAGKHHPRRPATLRRWGDVPNRFQALMGTTGRSSQMRNVSSAPTSPITGEQF